MCRTVPSRVRRAPSRPRAKANIHANARTGQVPKEFSRFTNHKALSLNGNDALEKPPGCPVDSDGDMYYGSKGDVAAFLRCLA